MREGAEPLAIPNARADAIRAGGVNTPIHRPLKGPLRGVEGEIGLTIGPIPIQHDGDASIGGEGLIANLQAQPGRRRGNRTRRHAEGNRGTGLEGQAPERETEDDPTQDHPTGMHVLR